MVESEFGANNMLAWIIGWWWWCHSVGDIFWDTLAIEHCLNATASGLLHPLITKAFWSSWLLPVQIISYCFLEHGGKFKWTPQPPDLNPAEPVWDVVERELCITDMQQLFDALMSVRIKISGKFPAPSWIYITKNSIISEAKRGSNTLLARFT